MEGQPIRVFISSPGDVNAERRRAAIVVNRLAREFSRFFGLTAVLWEYEAMLASKHFQDCIVKPSETEIFVMILWSRLGTALPPEYHGIDGRSPVTGTEWEFEEALAKSRERGAPDLLVYRKETPGYAEFDREEQLEAARLQWRALQAFWERHFSADGKFKAGFNGFRDLDEFEKDLERHLRQLLRERWLPQAAVRSGRSDIIWTHGSPFRGLEVYEAEHAAIFFGREQAEREVIDALVRNAERGCAFLLLLGASGSGKSSLVRAGVIPTLTVPGVVTGVSLWRRCLFRSIGSSGDVFDRLAGALIEQALPELPGAGIQLARFADQLRVSPTQAALPIGVGLAAANRSESSQFAGAPRLILVIDQLEEMLTQPEVTAAEREGLIAVLAALSRSGQAWVIATLRDDFYHRIDDLPGLRELSAEGQYDLPRTSAAELGEIVRRPAEAAGIRYEGDETSGLGLDAIIAEAAGRGASALPLLSFSLDELYRRDIAEGGGAVLKVATYRAFGGLEGAIAARAEQVCAGFPEHAVTSVLRELVTLREGQEEATARPALRQEVTSRPERAALVDALVASRLVVSTRSAGGPVLRLAHEALIRHWPRLRQWVDEHRHLLRVRGRIEVETARWESEGRPRDLLLADGRLLLEARDLVAHEADLPLSASVSAFIEKSSTASRARRRWRTGALAAVVASLAAATVVSGYQWQALSRNRIEAKLLDYRETVRRANNTFLTAGASKERQHTALETATKALGLSGEVKAMRGKPPETADADAANLYEYAGILKAELEDPEGSVRDFEARDALLKASPQPNAPSLRDADVSPYAMSAFDLTIESIVAEHHLKALCAQNRLLKQALKDKLKAVGSVEWSPPADNCDSVAAIDPREELKTLKAQILLFDYLTRDKPRVKDFEWMEEFQFLAAGMDEALGEWEDAARYRADIVASARRELDWLRTTKDIDNVEQEKRRAAEEIAKALDELADFYIKRGDYENALKAAQEELKAASEEPELKQAEGRRFHAHQKVASVLARMGRHDDAVRELDVGDAAILDAEKSVFAGDWADYARLYQAIGGAREDIGDAEGSVAAMKKRLTILEEQRQSPAEPANSSQLAGAYLSLSWSQLLARQFADAGTTASQGLAVAANDQDKALLNTNLAHALMFQGHIPEARGIYETWKSKPIGEHKLFAQAVLDDFKAFDAAGMTSPAIPAIRAAMEAAVNAPKAPQKSEQTVDP